MIGESINDYDQVRGLGIAVWTVAVLVGGVHRGPRALPAGARDAALSVFLCGAPALLLTEPDVIRPLVLGYAMAGLVAEGLWSSSASPRSAALGAAVTGAASARCSGPPRSRAQPRGPAGLEHGPVVGHDLLSGMVGAAVASLVALPAPTGDAVVDSPLGPRPA